MQQPEELLYLFVPAGHHLSKSPEKMVSMINIQNTYLNEGRILVVVGISKKCMESNVEDFSK